MQLVEVAQYSPGCCVLGGGHERLVDFQRSMPMIREGDRMYVSQQMIADAAALMGYHSADQVAGYQRTIDALREQLERLEAVEEELEQLRRSVRATLEAGATVDRRDGTHKLRLARGAKREQLGV